MKDIIKFLDNLNDNEFEVAFAMVQQIYRLMLDQYTERVNEKVHYAEMQMKMSLMKGDKV